MRPCSTKVQPHSGSKPNPFLGPVIPLQCRLDNCVGQIRQAHPGPGPPGPGAKRVRAHPGLGPRPTRAWAQDAFLDQAALLCNGPLLHNAPSCVPQDCFTQQGCLFHTDASEHTHPSNGHMVDPVAFPLTIAFSQPPLRLPLLPPPTSSSPFPLPRF